MISAENRLASLTWIKKYQLCFVYADGSISFTEYKFEYCTSRTNHNFAGNKDHGYVAVVDGPAINLTPLGKFVMPPPMYEKQVALPQVPKSVSLYSHWGVAYIEKDDTIVSFNCETAQDASTVKSYKLGLNGR